MMIKIFKKFFIIFFLQCFFINSQPINHLKPIPFEIGFYSEHHFIPTDTVNVFYYLFNVQNNFLVFEKRYNQYLSSFRLMIEVYDSNNNFIIREIKDKQIITSKFDETNDNTKLNQLLIKIKLPNGRFIINPSFTDLNSKREFKLKLVKYNSEEINNSFSLLPIIILDEKIKLNQEDCFQVLNKEASIPFSSENYPVIIPVSDTSVKNISLNIKSEDNYFTFNSDESFISSFDFIEQENKIILAKGNKTLLKYFVINNFSNKLSEGIVNLKIFNSDDTTKKSHFIKEVKWFDKPKSLFNIEDAFQYLSYFEKEEIIDSIKSQKNFSNRKILFNYWKKQDPTLTTEFNELMAEFYSRVDYANENFSAINVKKGSATDRGKTFIKYGMPSNIERKNNIDGKVVEIWHYIKINKQFIFIDKYGTGKFELSGVQ